MSETVVSKITSRGGDFLLDAAEPGHMVQIKQFEYSSVFEDSDCGNKEQLMPGVFGSGAMKLTCSAGNRLHITCQMQIGHNETWRQQFFRMYWNGGETPAPAGYIIASDLAAGGNAGEGNVHMGITPYDRMPGNLLYGSGGGNVYIESRSGGLQTVCWSFVTPPIINSGEVSFIMTYVGHANGDPLHLNKNMTTNSNSATNTISCASTVLIKEIYFP